MSKFLDVQIKPINNGVCDGVSAEISTDDGLLVVNAWIDYKEKYTLVAKIEGAEELNLSVDVKGYECVTPTVEFSEYKEACCMTFGEHALCVVIGDKGVTVDAWDLAEASGIMLDSSFLYYSEISS